MDGVDDGGGDADDGVFADAAGAEGADFAGVFDAVDGLFAGGVFRLDAVENMGCWLWVRVLTHYFRTSFTASAQTRPALDPLHDTTMGVPPIAG